MWGNIKLEPSVSIKLLIKSESPYFNKSILRSPSRKILLEGSFRSFNSNGEIQSFVKSFIWSVRYLYKQSTINFLILNR